MHKKRLSIFIDESGDFGAYDQHAPYYLVTFIFHDQSVNLSEEINAFDDRTRQMGFQKHAIHAGPLIRREPNYENVERELRRKLFSSLYHFSRHLKINHTTIVLEKHKGMSSIEMQVKMLQKIEECVTLNQGMFSKYNELVIYYDNGQKELSRIITEAFRQCPQNIFRRKIKPEDYVLFQIADLVCTLELVALKFLNGTSSESEKSFFRTKKHFMKDFFNGLAKQRLR